MAILDIFKKKKIEKKEIIKKEKKEKKTEEAPKAPKIVKEEKVEKAPSVVRKATKKRKKFSGSYRVLKIPHVTEKATDLTKQDQYIFRVQSETNKIEVKKTVEDLYNIDVVSVQIINVPPKRRRLGKTLGWRKGYKKAIVRIKEGQKIEVLPR